MNKIYKLVWSKVRNTWVVASEIAKGHGKSSSPEGNGKLLKSLVLMALLGCFVTAGTSPVAAELTSDQKAVYDAVLQKLETEKKIVHYFSVNSGEPAKPAGTNWNNDGATGQDAIAIGKNAVSEGQDTIAIGKNAVSERQGSTAIGSQAEAYQDYSTAIGSTAIAGGHHATVLGYGAQTDSNRSTAIGSTAIAGGHYSTALGYGAQADWTYSTALGSNAEAQGIYSTALGGIAKAQGHYSTALGYLAQAAANNSVAIGRRSKALVNGSVALGAGAVADTKAGAVGYIATGGSATFEEALATLDKKEDYDKWTATINASKAEYDNLTKAFKDAPKGKKDEAKQALEKWKTEHTDFVEALTAKEKLEATWKATEAAVSVGADRVNKAGNRIIKSRQITNVAAGTKDTDAVNVAQLKSLATAPMNFYFGGSKDKNNTYTPGKTNWSMPLNEFRMDFGDGLKAEQVTDQDGKKYTLVTLNKDSLKGDPDFKGDKGEKGPQGPKGEDGAVGPQGPDGKSAYEVWKNHTEDDGSQPNKDKSEKDFLDSLKGKGGTDFTVTADGPKADSKFKVEADHAQLNIVGDKTNITTSIEKDNTVKVALNKDIKVDSVEVGSKDGKPGVKIDGDGINMNGKKIENLAPGTAANDAATVGQVNEVRDESREGDAMNAALAALKPLDFDPYNRSQVMAGVSTYKGKQAVAVGLAHYSNEDTLVHAGIAYGGSSDLMANAGISWRFGNKDDRDARAKRAERLPQYADGPISSVYVMQDEMAALRAENQSLKEENQEIKRQVEMLMKHAGLKA